jgi:hypothetical protein
LRHVPTERKHSDDARGLAVLCWLLTRARAAGCCSRLSRGPWHRERGGVRFALALDPGVRFQGRARVAVRLFFYLRARVQGRARFPLDLIVRWALEPDPKQIGLCALPCPSVLHLWCSWCSRFICPIARTGLLTAGSGGRGRQLWQLSFLLNKPEVCSVAL